MDLGDLSPTGANAHTHPVAADLGDSYAQALRLLRLPNRFVGGRIVCFEDLRSDVQCITFCPTLPTRSRETLMRGSHSAASLSVDSCIGVSLRIQSEYSIVEIIYG